MAPEFLNGEQTFERRELYPKLNESDGHSSNNVLGTIDRKIDKNVLDGQELTLNTKGLSVNFLAKKKD